MNEPPHHPPDDAARRALADVEPIDEVTRRRMIAAALAEGPGAAATRRMRVLGVAAVAVLALGAVGTMALLDDDGGEQVAGVGADEALALPIGPEQVVAGAGALDDSQVLLETLTASEDFFYGPSGALSGGGGRSVSGGGSASAGEAPVADDTDSAGGESVQAPSPPSEVRATSEPDPDTMADLTRCYATLAGTIPEESGLTAAATGTYQGAEVVVLGFRSADGRLLAMILARSDCTILNAQSFR